MSDQVDNSHGAAKLALRRQLLNGLERRPLRVLDCCAGSEQMWGTLRQEYKVRYTGLDVKKKAGRLKIDSRRYLESADLTSFDVIDVDTYGSPWEHWETIARKVRGPLVVFLTLGLGARGLTCWGYAARRVLGVPANTPDALVLSAAMENLDVMITGTARCEVLEIWEGFPHGDTRYIGIKLGPKKSEKTFSFVLTK